MMDGVKRIRGIRVDWLERRARQAVPFLGFDGFPPRDCQPDLVAPRHKDMAVIRKSMLPDPHTVIFLQRASGKSTKHFDQLCEMRFVKGVFEAKHSIWCAS